jgi:hypothetical protein
MLHLPDSNLTSALWPLYRVWFWNFIVHHIYELIWNGLSINSNEICAVGRPLGIKNNVVYWNTLKKFDSTHMPLISYHQSEVKEH